MDREPKYVKMIFDSGASCTAMPAEVGEGYPIIQDQWAGEKYGGMMEGMKAADEGRRTINFIDEHWKDQKITHRVVEKMQHPRVSAGETIDGGQLVFMSRGTSFIVPESSHYGRALEQAVWTLGAQYGTHDCVEMYRDLTNVFVFDAWVKPPPRGLHSVSKDPKGRNPAEAGARAPADAGTRFGSEERTVAASGKPAAGSASPKPEKTAAFMDSDNETKEYAVDSSDDEYTGPWKKIGKKNKKIIENDADKQPQTRQGFQWRVPSWPQPAGTP